MSCSISNLTMNVEQIRKARGCSLEFSSINAKFVDYFREGQLIQPPSFEMPAYVKRNQNAWNLNK